MKKRFSVVLAVAALMLAFGSRHFTRVLRAQEGQTPILITEPIDESRLVTLVGNTRPEANGQNDRGRVADNFVLDHMLLQLKRAPELEREFEQHIDSLSDKSSPNYHHWLTAEEQGQRFGLAQSDLDTITGWLRAHGFTVGYVYPNRTVIDFSGTAGQIAEALHTEIHYLDVEGELHFANMIDPRIPEALAPALVGVVSMHDFKPHPMYEPRGNYTFSGCGGNCYSLVPADIQTIYNISPLYGTGVTGKGQTVVVVEDSNSYGSDWSNYQSKFGLTAYGGTLTTKHPNDAGNCTNPGTNGDDIEADLDVEMVTAVAPAATVELASCADTATFGGLIAIQNLVSKGSPPAVISMSYGECEVYNGAASNAAFSSAFQSAAAAGVSVFVSAGDNGATTCARNFGMKGGQYALSGIGITGWGESIYNVSVGGTDFEDVYNYFESGGLPLSTYWSASNGATYGSALGYIPEIPWDDSCASYLIYQFAGFAAPYGSSGYCNNSQFAPPVTTVAGGGGPSGCATGSGNATYLYVEDTSCAGYAKPSWQKGTFGNPQDGVRDIPDVSLFAANGYWGHFITICASDPGSGGVPCTGAPSTWYGVGGTSASSPMMAAIQALINENWGIRTGNPNPVYYEIAQGEFGSTGNSSCYSINQPPPSGQGGVQPQGPPACPFYDITQGDNDVDCEYDGSNFKADCYLPSGTYGALGTQQIGSLNLTAGGSGYTSTPTCTIDAPADLSKYLSPTGTTIYAGGTNAKCTATINKSTRVVTAVTLTNKGQGYTGVPICAISGGGGTGALCYAVIKPKTAAGGYHPSFGATPGWDMATGIGSVNAWGLALQPEW